MIRFVLAIPLTVALVLLAATPSTATTTTTQTFKDVTMTFVAPTPCTAGLATITTTSNGVFHTTVLDNGTAHGTFTQTGTFALVPLDPTAQSISGHFAIWGGFNANADNFETTFTFNISGHYADGTPFSVHAVDHLNTTASGMMNLFSKLHC
jgi:hypothetical protein